MVVWVENWLSLVCFVSFVFIVLGFVLVVILVLVFVVLQLVIVLGLFETDFEGPDLFVDCVDNLGDGFGLIWMQVEELETHKIEHHNHFVEFCFKYFDVLDLHQVVVIFVVFMVFVVGAFVVVPVGAVKGLVFLVFGLFDFAVVQSWMSMLFAAGVVRVFSMFDAVGFLVFVQLGPFLLDGITFSGATMLDFG